MIPGIPFALSITSDPQLGSQDLTKRSSAMKSAKNTFSGVRWAIFCHLLAFFLVLFGHAMAYSAPLIASPLIESNEQEFKFHYQWQNQHFELSTRAKSFEDALGLAAQKCFDFYRKATARGGTLEMGQEIIDICVNPHKS